MKYRILKFFCLLFTVLYLLVSFSASAQNSIDEKAADFLRESNKLYVVISILVTIFAGIIIFLIFQERKISKLEQQLKDKKP
jgi:CcmD family protein